MIGEEPGLLIGSKILDILMDKGLHTRSGTGAGDLPEGGPNVPLGCLLTELCPTPAFGRNDCIAEGPLAVIGGTAVSVNP